MPCRVVLPFAAPKSVFADVVRVWCFSFLVKVTMHAFGLQGSISVSDQALARRFALVLPFRSACCMDQFV